MSSNKNLDLEILASSISKIGDQDIKEGKLKLETEKRISEFFGGQKVSIDPSYEHTFIPGDRADALYGHLHLPREDIALCCCAIFAVIAVLIAAAMGTTPSGVRLGVSTNIMPKTPVPITTRRESRS